MKNVLNIVFGGSRNVTTAPLWQYDTGQVAKFYGVDLPANYEVHFSNSSVGGTAVTRYGDENGVEIPDSVLTSGEPVYVWLYLHEGVYDGETEYSAVIPVNSRPARDGSDPTPEEADAIAQALEALSEATDETYGAAALATAAADAANTAADAANTAADEATAAAAEIDDKVAGKLDKRTSSGLEYAYTYYGSNQSGRPVSDVLFNGSIMMRGDTGKSQVADPEYPNDVANKRYVDSHSAGGVTVTNLFSGSVAPGNYIVQNINEYKGYIVESTAGSSAISHQNFVIANSYHFWIDGHYLLTGDSYVGEVAIHVPQDTTKRSLYFNSATTLPIGYGDVTITGVWGVNW